MGLKHNQISLGSDTGRNAQFRSDSRSIQSIIMRAFLPQIVYSPGLGPVSSQSLVSVSSHRRLKHERCELLLFNKTKAHFNDHTASFSYFSTNIYHSSYGIVLCNCGYNQSIELMIQ